MPSGAPKGNNNAGKNKPWRDALNVALARYEKGDVKKGQALRLIAESVVQQAIEGSKDAFQEIANRLDGKPHQSMDVTGELGVIQTVINAQPEQTVQQWQKTNELSGDHSQGRKLHS